MASRMSRRQLLVVFGGVGLSAITVACNSQAIPVPTAVSTGSSSSFPTAHPTNAPAGEVSPKATLTQPAPVAQAKLNEVPRNQTLIMSVSDSVNQMNDATIFNPFLNGAQRTGWHFAFEPLYFYNPWWTKDVSGPPGLPAKDGEIPYLATIYEYNQDYTELAIKLREGVTWSDGKPFTSRDVIFTINMLRDNAPKLNFSFDIKKWVKDVVASSDHDVKIILNAPNPHFMFEYFMWHQDVGFPILPEHVFKGQDAQTFTNLDLAKGPPVVTGPWQLVLSSPTQKVFDRRDDWWGARTGFHPLPKMKRVIVLPRYEDSKLTQLLISNQVDCTHNLSPADAEVVLAKNPKLIVRTADKSHPWGWLDWWTNALGFNDSKPPFNDPDIRWAVNHAIDRKQLVELGFKGDSQATVLPFPAYTPMLPYFDAVSDILQKYPIDDYDPNKTAQIMQSKGYQKDSGGFWAKDGKRLSMIILLTPGFFENFAPVLVAMLRKAGFDASFKSPTNKGTLEAQGDLDAFLDGHGGGVRDPYPTLNQYHSQYSAPTGQPAQQPYRWKNEAFDKIVDQLAQTSPNDSKFMTLYHHAMEQWIPNLPDIPTVQWFLIMPVNTTYWKNWPTDKNPYCAPSCWHRGSATLLLNTLEPV
jgi:peptide/nickel transport system substrate-binding protein